jgi:hypothetical protein
MEKIREEFSWAHTAKSVEDILHRHAIARRPHPAESDRKPVAVGRLACLADRHDHTAPIRVLARNRGLHERRIRDRHADTPGGLVALCAGNRDADEFRRPLAVLHDLMREIEHDVVQRGTGGLGRNAGAAGKDEAGGVIDGAGVAPAGNLTLGGLICPHAIWLVRPSNR